jgi:hypothetical protein
MNRRGIQPRSLAGSAALLVAAAAAGSIASRGVGSHVADAARNPSPATPSVAIRTPIPVGSAGSGAAPTGSATASSARVRPTAHSPEHDRAGSEAQDSTPTTVSVESQFKDPGELTDIQRARCGVAQPGVCEAQLGGHSTLTGTMSGWTDYTTWGHGNADGSISYYSHETFTGSVAGCGRGSFEFVVEDGRVGSGPSDQDPAAKHLHGSWILVPRSGTGDLARLIAGNGEEDGLYYPDSSLSGAFTGSVTCGR